ETPYSLAQQTMNLSPRKAGKVSVIIPCGEGIFNHGPVSSGSSVGFWARDAINTKNTYIITTGHGIDSRRLGLNEFYPWPWENNEPPPESRKNLIGTPVAVSVNTVDYALIK
ncbi:30203_t:CDS:1, partial [Gigaspora margarita]